MTKKGIILFDIDKTIFDTYKFKRITSEKIGLLLNKDVEEILSSDEEYTNNLPHRIDFDPATFSVFLCKTFNFGKNKLIEDIYYSDKNCYEECVYPGVKQVLNELESNYELGIFSEGTKKFQNHKFRSLGLDDYFNEDLIFIRDAKNTPEVMKELPVEATIVDDKEHICEFLTKNGFKAIWLNKIDDRESANFPTIHNLLELPRMLV
jgi:FMN phosphatase YigB (HAD superfamily)